MSLDKHPEGSIPNQEKPQSSIKPLDEQGILDIFSAEEIEEFRRELAKSSKALKKKLRGAKE